MATHSGKKRPKASSLRKPGETLSATNAARRKITSTPKASPKARPKAKLKAKPKESVRDSVRRALNTSNAASKGRKMGGGKAGAIIAGLGVIGSMTASYFSGKSDKSQVGDKSKSNPSSAWSSNRVQPIVAKNSKGEKSKTGASTVVLPRTKSKGTGNNATKPPSVEASSVRKPDGAIPTHSQAKPNTPTAPKVVYSGGRGGAMSSSDIEAMRKGYPTNIISSGGRGTMGNTPKKVAAIRAGRLANVSKIKPTTPAKTKSISTRGSADTSKKDTPSLRKTSVDTESYSGAIRPKPGFEFNDNTAPKPLNKAGGTKNTPDGFSQFMANLTGVDVTPDLGTDIKGKKRKAVTAKNKTGGAFFGMFK
jgi:hypothetical protein